MFGAVLTVTVTVVTVTVSTVSQCRDLRIGVTREDLGVLTTVHARQF